MRVDEGRGQGHAVLQIRTRHLCRGIETIGVRRMTLIDENIVIADIVHPGHQAGKRSTGFSRPTTADKEHARRLPANHRSMQEAQPHPRHESMEQASNRCRLFVTGQRAEARHLNQGAAFDKSATVKRSVRA